MAKLESMTVETLRKLARRVLGPASAGLESKKALLAALRAAGAAPPGEKALAPPAARKAAAPKAGGAKRSASAGAAAGEKAPARKGAGKKPAGSEAARQAVGAPKAEADAPGVDPEAYFVARVRGEEAARAAPHPMTEAAVEAQRPPAVRELRER